MTKLSSHFLLPSPDPPLRRVLLFLCGLLLISVSKAAVRLPKNVTIPAVIVFGDSIVDQGNNNGLTATVIKCNFPPYGKDFLAGIPTGRFCNGKTPADLIAEELGIKEFLPAYLDPHLLPIDLPTGVSFASGATGFDPQTAQLMNVYTMSDQLKMFEEYIQKLKLMVGEEESGRILTNSMYMVVTGTDDLANTYFSIGTRRFQYDINSYTDFLVQSASQFVMELYKMGAKRIAVFGHPPIGCLPSQRTLAGGELRQCAENYNQAAQLYNSKLSSALSSLNSSLHDAKARVLYVDAYTPLLDLIQNHDKYGFAVADRGCCGTGTVEVVLLCNHLSETCSNRSAYLFWDSYHPTERGYKILVDRILQRYFNRFL